jgi:hypothetical protein
LDLYLDLLATASVAGRFAGVGRGSLLAQAEAALGEDFLDDLHRKKRLLRRDYGLVELTFVRRPDWVCAAVSIQVHRLASGAPEVVPRPVRDSHGDFPRTVPFAPLAEAVRQKGHDVRAAPAEADRSFLEYQVEGTTTQIYVVREDAPQAAPPNRAGDVWSISL